MPSDYTQPGNRRKPGHGLWIDIGSECKVVEYESIQTVGASGWELVYPAHLFGRLGRTKLTHVNERRIECLAGARARTVLDVGTGTTAWPHLLANCGFTVTAIDNIRDSWDHQVVNRHWTVLDVDIGSPGEFRGQFDVITCISVIEHNTDHENAVGNMLNLLVPDGLLIVTTPYNHHEYCGNVYKRIDAFYGRDMTYICRSHSAKEIEQWQKFGARLKRREMWRLFSGPVWEKGGRIDFEQAQSEGAAHQLRCFLFEKV